ASTPNPRPAPVPEAVSPRPAPKPAPAPASRPGPKLAPAPRTASAPRPSVAPRPSASPHRPLAEALPPRAPLDTEPEEVDSDDLLEEDLTSPGVSAAEETPLELARRTEPPPAEPRAARIRQDVTELLGRIGRLPPNSEYLSLAILRSMALMYEHMKTRRTKAQRAQTVRDSFDNEAHLRIAMTALITMLDASATSGELDKLSPDTLVDRLLREERSIWQRSKRSAEDAPDALPSRRAVHVKAHGPPPSRR
ncbi:MAG: hypothetical protein OZ921_20700, partial [Sorangiineae bacterium]|nr:hypothetical protein [Sorangiineae bacterium]